MEYCKEIKENVCISLTSVTRHYLIADIMVDNVYARMLTFLSMVKSSAYSYMHVQGYNKVTSP